MSKKQLQKKDKGKEKREKKGKGKEKMVEPEVVKKPRGKPGPKPKPKPIPVDKLQQMIANLDNIQSTAGSSKVVSRKKDKKQAEELEDEGPEGSHRKSRRKATVQSSLQTEKKQIESSKKASQRAAYGARTRVDHVYTQEELLEEAKITEEYNIESLRLYHLMELEKKAPLKRVVVYDLSFVVFFRESEKVDPDFSLSSTPLVSQVPGLSSTLSRRHIMLRTTLRTSPKTISTTSSKG